MAAARFASSDTPSPVPDDEAGADLNRRIRNYAPHLLQQGVEPMSGITPTRRVRHDVRDGLMVMGFSLTSSCALAFVLILLTRAGS